MKDKGAYRPKKAGDIAAIEARRIAGGFTVDELVGKAAMTDRTYRNIKRSGRAFPRHVRALQMALRTLERERGREGDIFPFSPPESSRPLARPGRGGVASGIGVAGGSAARIRK